MYSYSSKRGRENELFLTPETVSNVNEMQRMVFRTFPVTSGSYMEAEPRNKRFLPSTFESGLQNSGTARVPDRVGLYEGNRLLSDEQIQRFISNTVLPHHRSLITNKGGNWSQAQTDSRPAQPSFQKRIKTNHAPLSNMGGLLERPVLHGNPVFISIPQEAQRGSQGSRGHFLDKPHGKLTEFPCEFNVPIKRQRFPIPQETLVNNFSAPLSTQVANSNQEDTSYPKRTSEGNSKYPKGTQEINNCFPQGSQKEIFSLPTIATGEIINVPYGNGVPQETKEKYINFPQGIQSLTHGTMGSEETEDDIIIVHDGTPEELLSIFEETLQEIMSIPQRTTIPQETMEIMGIPQGITIPQGTVEETTAFPQGTIIPHVVAEETMAFPRGITISQETVAENMHNPQGINFPQGTEEVIMAIPQGSTILQGAVEETMPFSHGFNIPQETLYEIMGIPQGITVPKGTLQEMMDIPQGTAIPQGIQEQVTPLEIQNKYEGSSCLLYQEQKAFMKCQVATSSNGSAQHQPCSSYNQSTQNLITETFPLQVNPKQNHAPGGRAYTDPDPLLAYLSLPTNADWGGTAGQQIDTERSVVTDTVNPGHEFISGNCRKRKRCSSSEATFGKRQRLDLQTNGDRGQNERLSEENTDAGKMALSGRNPEDEEFFASIEKCLEQSSEAFPSKEKYAFFEDLENASLDSFPTEAIEDIYENTFKSDCFLTSGDDFVVDSLVFLKQSVLDSLC